MLGWAGWDDREQAHALIGLIEERSSIDDWDAVHLTPLLAGLAQVMPWVHQWHDEVDPSLGQSPAEAYDAYFTTHLEEYGLTVEDLTGWDAPPIRRGRPPKAQTTLKAAKER